jgi:glycine oxidase
LSDTYLIVGQGLAGITLAHALCKGGARVEAIDQPDAQRATSVAAGIINPISGNRFVLGWRYFEHFEVAERFYTELQSELGIKLWQRKSILRLLRTLDATHTWVSQSGFYNKENELFHLNPDAGAWSDFIQAPSAYGLIHHAAQVNIALLCETWRERGLREGWFRSESFDWNTLPAVTQKYKGVICATGHTASSSGLFTELPWNHAKGTVAHVYIPDLPAQARNTLLKDKILLAPLQDKPHLYWAGANYEWNQSDAWPTAIGIDEVVSELQKTLNVYPQIHTICGGIRPVIKDRRPIMGISKSNDKVFIFNALGAKGTLHAPWCAEHMAQFLLHRTPLDTEVDVRRF